ncbi:hypothetical protein J437_LFUL000759 [Ladona fulva]|uniref:Uncharacterized protein n=1 Tax=Ladona fulva TaxID=123851 RepID=A0A8K0KPL5_LADFU|nr:hypothetical protein J437_LFUL000759 [Ladona fulva]
MPPPPMLGPHRPLVPGFPPVGLAQPMAAGQPVNISQNVGMMPTVHPMTQQMGIPPQPVITSQPMSMMGPPLAPPLAMAPPMSHPMATVAPIGITPQAVSIAQTQPPPTPPLSLDTTITAITAPGTTASIQNGAAILGQSIMSTAPLVPAAPPTNIAQAVPPAVPAPPSLEGTPQRSNSVASLESP